MKNPGKKFICLNNLDKTMKLEKYVEEVSDLIKSNKLNAFVSNYHENCALCPYFKKCHPNADIKEQELLQTIKYTLGSLDIDPDHLEDIPEYYIHLPFIDMLKFKKCEKLLCVYHYKFEIRFCKANKKHYKHNKKTSKTVDYYVVSASNDDLYYSEIEDKLIENYNKTHSKSYVYATYLLYKPLENYILK